MFIFKVFVSCSILINFLSNNIRCVYLFIYYLCYLLPTTGKVCVGEGERCKLPLKQAADSSKFLSNSLGSFFLTQLYLFHTQGQ